VGCWPLALMNPSWLVVTVLQSLSRSLSVQESVVVSHSQQIDKLIEIPLLRISLGFERYRYWGIGYWPILASIGWYWYGPNTFLSNRAQYWADNYSLRRRLATHDDLISRMRADCLTADRGKAWESDTQTPGVGVRVKCACEIRYLSRTVADSFSSRQS